MKLAPANPLELPRYVGSELGGHAVDDTTLRKRNIRFRTTTTRAKYQARTLAGPRTAYQRVLAAQCVKPWPFPKHELPKSKCQNPLGSTSARRAHQRNMPRRILHRRQTLEKPLHEKQSRPEVEGAVLHPLTYVPKLDELLPCEQNDPCWQLIQLNSTPRLHRQLFQLIGGSDLSRRLAQPNCFHDEFTVGRRLVQPNFSQQLLRTTLASNSWPFPILALGSSLPSSTTQKQNV